MSGHRCEPASATALHGPSNCWHLRVRQEWSRESGNWGIDRAQDGSAFFCPLFRRVWKGAYYSCLEPAGNRPHVRHHSRFVLAAIAVAFAAVFSLFRAVLVAVGAVPPCLPRAHGPFGEWSPKPPAATPTCATTSTPWRPSWVKCRAQLLRLDSLSERVSSLAGIKPSEQPPSLRGAQGGPLLLAQPRTALTNSTTRCRGSASISMRGRIR